MKGSTLWLNGEFINEKDAKISLFTHGLHYGTGVFEGIRAYKQNKGGGAVFKLREHMQRLHNSCKILGLSVPFSVEDLCKTAVEVCRKNNFEECYIRPLVYVSEGPLGLGLGKDPPISVAIMTWEWGAYLGDKGIKEGIRTKISSYIRPHVNSMMTKGKICGQYTTSVMAKREAMLQGFDEALFLDHDGYLTEGSGENLFMVKNGKIKTTPLTSVLDGITRQTVIEHLTQQGVEIAQTRFTRDELWCADEIFLCGTAAEVTPVREVDNRVIGKPGPVTQKLQQDYANFVRGDVPSYGKNWLTAI